MAEELVWTAALGLGDGKMESLPDTRRLIQAGILEALGFHIGNPTDPNTEKRETALKNLREKMEILAKIWGHKSELKFESIPLETDIPTHWSGGLSFRHNVDTTMSTIDECFEEQGKYAGTHVKWIGKAKIIENQFNDWIISVLIKEVDALLRKKLMDTL